MTVADVAYQMASWLVAGAVVLTGYLTIRLIVHLARNYAEDRRREQKYGDEWCATHRKHQHDRHDHSDPTRPE